VLRSSSARSRSINGTERCERCRAAIRAQCSKQSSDSLQMV
jgi:hypothetical protein